MNLNMFDDIDGLILRERESSLAPKSAAPVNISSAEQLFSASVPLAMAYVPFQQISQTYEPEKALHEGTLFPELNFPFEKGGAR